MALLYDTAADYSDILSSILDIVVLSVSGLIDRPFTTLVWLANEFPPAWCRCTKNYHRLLLPPRSINHVSWETKNHACVHIMDCAGKMDASGMHGAPLELKNVEVLGLSDGKFTLTAFKPGWVRDLLQ